MSRIGQIAKVIFLSKCEVSKKLRAYFIYFKKSYSKVKFHIDDLNFSSSSRSTELKEEMEMLILEMKENKVEYLIID
jgi:hypothetical protein